MGYLRSIASRFDPSQRLLSKPCNLSDKDSKKLHHLRIGEFGEKLAALYIKRRGLKLLYSNYRAPTGGEVDLIIRDRDVLVFAEVKTRSSNWADRPADAVDEEKQRLIARGAVSWLRRLDIETPYMRFDIIEVILQDGEIPNLNQIENAFHLPDGYYL